MSYTASMKRAVVVVRKLTDAEVKRQCCRSNFSKQEAEVKRQCSRSNFSKEEAEVKRQCCRSNFSKEEAEVKRQCCRRNFSEQEAVVQNMEYVAPPNPADPPAAMTIKSEVPDEELDAVTVKEEFIDWDKEPQVNSNAVSSAFTMKREDEVCAVARSEHAESDGKLQEGSSGACNTSAVHQRSAVASQEGADCVPSQVSGAVRSDRYQQNSQVPAEVSDTNRNVEIKPDRCQKFLCEFCDYSTNQKYDLKVHLTKWHKLGVLLECEFCDYTCTSKYQLKVHLGNKHGIGEILKCELCEYSTAGISFLREHLANKHAIGKLFKCEYCNYSGARKRYLIMHLTSKHGEGKMLKCESCGYATAYKSSLREHLATKHGVGKLLKCEYCYYSCAREWCLRQHLARKHGKGKMF